MNLIDALRQGHVWYADRQRWTVEPAHAIGGKSTWETEDDPVLVTVGRVSRLVRSSDLYADRQAGVDALLHLIGQRDQFAVELRQSLAVARRSLLLPHGYDPEAVFPGASAVCDPDDIDTSEQLTVRIAGAAGVADLAEVIG